MKSQPVRHCEDRSKPEVIDLSTILDCSQIHNDGRGGNCGQTMSSSVGSVYGIGVRNDGQGKPCPYIRQTIVVYLVIAKE
jgi:hypothetical protein